MDERRRLSLIVGVFAVAALVAAGGVLLSLGTGGGLLRPQYRLVTYFDDVEGLVAGAPVRLAGKDVGTVEFVTFAAFDTSRPPVRVVLQVDSSVSDRVRSDSLARIGTIGLLGDKYVSISMGTQKGRVLQDGDELASVSPIDMNTALVRGTEAIDNIASLTHNLNQMVEDFGKSMGGRNVAQATAGLSEIVREIQQGNGLLHGIIYDRYEGGTIQSLQKSTASLEQILGEVQHGKGLIHELVYEPVGAGRSIEELNRSLADTGAAARRLESVLAKVDEGQGTLGLLVNDPSLYADVQALVGGAQRSLVVRSLIRLATDAE